MELSSLYDGGLSPPRSPHEGITASGGGENGEVRLPPPTRDAVHQERESDRLLPPPSTPNPLQNPNPRDWALMDFRSLPNGLFPPLPPHVGFMSGEIGMMRLPSRDALRRELMKERIREEIIAREISERRILEEEVRLELEIERAMAIRRLPPLDPFMRAAPPPLVRPVPPGLSEVRDKQKAEVVTEPALMQTNHCGIKRKADEANSGSNKKACDGGGSEINRQDAGGGSSKIKGKAGRRRSRKFQGLGQEWRCAICNVTATCEEDLKRHLSGKKHRSRMAGAGDKEVVSAPKTAPSSEQTRAQSAASDAHGVKKVNMLVAGKTHQVVQQSDQLWCELCHFKCSSAAMMAEHLLDRRHLAQAEIEESSQSNIKPVTTATSTTEKEARGEQRKGDYIITEETRSEKLPAEVMVKQGASATIITDDEHKNVHLEEVVVKEGASAAATTQESMSKQLPDAKYTAPVDVAGGWQMRRA